MAMAIIISLDVLLAKRKMQSKHLAKIIDITPRNFSLLKTGKVKAIRIETLNKICKALKCQPGDILEFIEDETEEVENNLEKVSVLTTD
jgi:putative transcriptional regulator